MRTFRHLISWVLALVLIAFCLHLTLHPLPDPPPGMVKFFDPPGAHSVFAALAERTGLTLFEPAGRFVAGTLELLAALLILLPFTRRLGAGLLVVMFGIGLGLHLSPWLGREVMMPDGMTDGGLQFLNTVIVFALGILLLVVHPGKSSSR